MKVLSQGDSNVRQGITDRGSASIADLVAVEPQFLQYLVLTANQIQTHLDNAIINPKNSGGAQINVL